jgi:YtkA-like protein
MRPAVFVVALLLAVSAAGCHGGKKKAFGGAGDCPPPASTASAGSAQINAKAIGKGFAKLVVIRAADKASGTPVHKGKVTVRAEMSCPHFMPLYTKKLKETSTGTYKAGYNLVMPGQWTFYITVRSKQGDATTSALPVRVKSSG